MLQVVDNSSEAVITPKERQTASSMRKFASMSNLVNSPTAAGTVGV